MPPVLAGLGAFRARLSLLVNTPLHSCPPAVTTAAHYTNPALIIPCVHNREASAIIGELCSALCREGRVNEPFPFFNAVISHELLSHTVTPEGWALPHARLNGLPQLSFAVGRSAAPFDWLGTTAHRVQLVFLFAVPQADGGDYLNLLSGLAKASQNSTLAARLIEAPDSQTVFEVLQQVRLPEARPLRS